MRIALLLFGLILGTGLYAQKSVKDCIKKVDQLDEDVDLIGALRQCSECLEKFPNSSELYFKRGILNYWLNHMHEAASDFRDAVDNGYVPADTSDIEFMKWHYDTLFIIRNITDSLEFPNYDPELNYKKRPTLADTLQGMLRQERTCMDVTHENLEVKIIPETKSIAGSNEIYFTAVEVNDQIQIDLYHFHEVDRITMDSAELKFKRVHNAVFIDLPKPLVVGEKYMVKVEYHGTPREAPDPPWNGGFVWKKNGDRHHIGVACEHLGASSWWPNKDHLSDKPNAMDIKIIAPEGYDVVSNGNHVETVPAEEGYESHHWQVHYPINNYNVTFYIGDFEKFDEFYENLSGQKVSVEYYILKENLEKAKTYYSGTRRVLEVFEKLFGEYAFPDDGLAFVESPFAGMEHQSAIAIGGDYGKDSVYAMRGKYDMLVVHEAAHEWWGNAVAVPDMAHVWINEGFATYSEHLFLEEEFGREMYLKEVADNMISISNIWPLVGRENINDNAFQGQDIYYKGAALLHTLRCIYNDNFMFRKMMSDYYNTAKLKMTTTEDFIAHAKKYTIKELDGFFEVFLHQASPPILEYSIDQNRKKGTLGIVYKWTNVPSNFQMPFLIVLDGMHPVRIDCSTTTKRTDFKNVDNFYLYNPNDFDETIQTMNAFTYYFSRYVGE